MKIFIKGLHGCKMRAFDVQRYKDFYTAIGDEIVDYPEQADEILLWTCAFRADYRDFSLKAIKFYSEYKKILHIAGCLPDICTELSLEGATDIIKWKEEQIYFGDLLKRLGRPYCEAPNPASTHFADQFVKLHISEGCKFDCTYCSEKLAFPPYKSFPADELADECIKTVENTGVDKVIILADSAGEYGSDTGSSLPKLLRQIWSRNVKISFAIHHLHPTHFLMYEQEFMRLIKDGIIFHLVLPIQSASDIVLKSMNRTYTEQGLIRIFDELRWINFNRIETHIIVGYPAETEEDFKQTLHFLTEFSPRYVLSSTYMGNKEVPSTLLPEVIAGRQKIIKQVLESLGIIVNIDGGELSQKRFNELNKI